MAIKEFIIGPQNYFEENYFSGDYTESNVSRAFLECDIDNIKGGRFVTGEYYEGEYIDGSYYHNNSIIAVLTVEAMVVQDAVISATNYYQDNYFELGYYADSGSRFTIVIELGSTIDAQGAFESAFTSAASVGKLQSVSASVESNSTVDATAVKTVDVQSALAAEFAVTATISHIEGADLFAFAEAQLALAVSRLRDYSASVDGVFDIATDYIRIKQLSADAAAEFTQSALVLRNRVFDSQIEVTVSLAASGDRIVDATAVLACSATVSAVGNATFQFKKTRLENGFNLGAFLQPANPGRPLAQTANTLSVAAGDYDSTIKKFGTHSARIDGNNGVVYAVPNNNTFDNDYLAIEFWIYSNSTNVPILQAKDSGGTSRYLAVTGPTAPADLRFQIGSTTLFTSVALTADVWNHVLILTRTGSNQTAVYLNGVRRALGTNNSGFGLANGSFAIGDWQAGNLARVDEFRVLKGTSSFPNNFNPANTTVTVPTQAFENSEDTSLLVHFDATADDDVSYAIPVAAFLHSETRVDAVVNNVTNANAQLSAVAALSAQVNADFVANASLSSAASVSAAGGFTIEGSADIASAMSFTAEVGALNPGEVEATVIATLDASGNRIRGVTATTLVVTTQVAQANRLQGILETFTATTVLAADGDKFKGIIQNLSSTSSLSAEPNFKHLQLINGGTIAAVDAADSDTWLSGLAMTNMWLRLSRNLNNNETITLWRANARGFISDPDYTTNLKLTKLSTGAYRFAATRYVQSDSTFFISSGISFTTVATNIDFTQWHNVTVPLIGSENYGAASFDGVPAINGAVFTSTGGTSTLTAGTVETSFNPGTWGDSTKTDLSIFINKLWIKQTGFPNSIRDTDFYNDATDWEVEYGVNGTVGGITPEVFHNWEQGIFETGNNLAPQWNYTKIGTVFTGLTFDIGASVSSSSQLVSTAELIVNVNADLNVVAAQTTINDRLREPGVALASEFALNVDFDRFRSPGAKTLSAVAVQTTVAVKTARTASNQNAEFAQTAIGQRLRLADSALSASANLNLPFGEIFKTPGNTLVTSEFTQTASANRIRDNLIDTESIATQLSAVAKIGDFLVTMETFSQLTAEVTKQTDVVSNQIVEATLNANAIKTVFGAGSADSKFTAVADVDKIKRVEAALNAEFTVAIPGQKVAGGVAAFESSTDVVSTPNRIRDSAVDLNTTTELSVPVIEVAILFEADLTAVATGLFVITLLVQAQADLQVTGFQLTAGRVIHIDQFNTLVVSGERRRIKVLSEDRIIKVNQETRILMV